MEEEQATEKRPWVKPVMIALSVEDTELQSSGPNGDGGLCAS